MDYQNYTVEDFIQDEKFINWILTGDADLKKFWDQCLIDYPDLKPAFQEAGSILHNLQFEQESLPTADKAEIWENIKEQTIESDSPVVVRSLKQNYWISVAAALAFLVLSFGVWQLIINPEITFSTSNGEQNEWLLSDGSQVILNANSSLSFRKRNPRKVWLDGEGYFQVAKKEETKADFQVITNDLAVRVLGTVFNVNSRNKATEVFLEEGKVNLEFDEKSIPSIEMSPGELVSYSRSNQHLTRKQQANLLENTSWKDGTLVFKDTPLEEVLNDLSEIYGVIFKLKDDSLQEKLISGGVPIKNLQIALETLEGIYGLEIHQVDSTYIIGN